MALLNFWTKMGFVVVLDACDELETVHMDKHIQGFGNWLPGTCFEVCCKIIIF